MVTVSKGRAVQGAQYFVNEAGYYSCGTWWGDGAEALNLSGDVEPKQFEKVLNGYSKNNRKLTQSAGKSNRIAYTDVTMSAPKSISIMAVLDSRIERAHQRAVDASLNELQSHYSLTRKGKNGVIKEITGSLVVAKFDHYESREMDPQLHTHCVVINATQRGDGKWGALENRPILDDQRLLGMMYQANLTKELHEIGYEMKQSTRTGITGNAVKGVEIACVSDDLITEYSKRGEQVGKAVEESQGKRKEIEEKYASGEMSKQAYNKWISKSYDGNKRKSRKSKNEELAKEIRAEISTKLHNNRYLVEHTKCETPIIKDITAEEILKATITDLEENEAVFDRKKILYTALNMSRGSGVTPKEIELEFPNYVKELHPGFYTTERIEKAAIESIRIANRGVGQSKLCVNRSVAMQYLHDEEDKGTRFKQSQYDSILSLAMSSDRVNILQGDAGAGKTFAVEHLRDMLAIDNIRVRGLAPTGKAAMGLSEVGIESSTLDSFFMQKKTPEKGEVWVVDESSMIGNLKMEKLLTAAESADAKVILIGDVKQLQAVDAGCAFTEMQNKSFTNRCDMTEGIRQKTAHTKEIVKHAKNKDSKAVVKAMLRNDSIKEFSGDKSRMNEAVTDYLFSKKSGQKTVLLCQTNSSRKEANSLVRDELKKTGMVDSGSFHNCLSDAGISAQKRRDANNYSTGMIVNLNSAIDSIPSGTQGEIVNLNLEDPAVSVRYWDKSEKQYCEQAIDLIKNGEKLQVYKKNNQEYGVGESILFLKNDKKLGVNNGDTGVIESIDESGDITVRIGKKHVSWNIRSTYNYFDYGYAMTNYKAQGATFDKSIILTDNSSRTNAEEFYVGLTRAKYETVAYVDSIKDLETFAGISQNKESVLKHIEKREEIIKEAELQEKIRIERVAEQKRVAVDQKLQNEIKEVTHKQFTPEKDIDSERWELHTKDKLGLVTVSVGVTDGRFIINSPQYSGGATPIAIVDDIEKAMDIALTNSEDLSKEIQKQNSIKRRDETKIHSDSEFLYGCNEKSGFHFLQREGKKSEETTYLHQSDKVWKVGVKKEGTNQLKNIAVVNTVEEGKDKCRELAKEIGYNKIRETTLQLEKELENISDSDFKYVHRDKPSLPFLKRVGKDDDVDTYIYAKNGKYQVAILSEDRKMFNSFASTNNLNEAKQLCHEKVKSLQFSQKVESPKPREIKNRPSGPSRGLSM